MYGCVSECASECLCVYGMIGTKRNKKIKMDMQESVYMCDCVCVCVCMCLCLNFASKCYDDSFIFSFFPLLLAVVFSLHTLLVFSLFSSVNLTFSSSFSFAHSLIVRQFCTHVCLYVEALKCMTNMKRLFDDQFSKIFKALYDLYGPQRRQKPTIT